MCFIWVMSESSKYFCDIVEFKVILNFFLQIYKYMPTEWFITYEHAIFKGWVQDTKINKKYL